MGNNSIQALRNIAPVMAKCLVFAPRQHIILLSDLWQLHIECEQAFNAATEPLLASMRLQWLHDALDTAQPPHGHELLLRLSAYHDRAGLSELQKSGSSHFSMQDYLRKVCVRDVARTALSRWPEYVACRQLTQMRLSGR